MDDDRQLDRIELLLVDDELDFLRASASALSRRGFEVITAGDAEGALRVLESRSVHAVVLDVKMPGMKGDELFDVIRKLWPVLPVIMLTGHGTVEQAFNTSRDGVFEYLSKPMDLDDLAAVVRRAVQAGQVPPPDSRVTEETGELQVLFVDDEEEFLRSAAGGLRRRGMTVVTATNAAAALVEIERLDFQVAVLDLKMPGMGGLELLQRLRRRRPLTEAILLTGQATISTAMNGMRFGAFEYLTKPCDVEVLAEKIRAARDERGRKEENLHRQRISEITEGRVD